MLQRRWFNGLRGEDGYANYSNVVSRIRWLTQNTFDKLFGFAERLRSAILKAGAIGVLQVCTTYA